MSDHRLNLGLAAALLALVALNQAVQPRPTRRLPNLPWTNMDRTAAAASFAPSAAFANGQVLQAPPHGTVRAVDPGRPPVGLHDPAAIERGATVFATYCAVCHGATMLGDGPVTRRGVPAPPSLLTETAAARADAELYRIVTDGRRTMPGYATQIEPDDRWCVIAYLRQLQREGLR